jgi:hypothetical protein
MSKPPTQKPSQDNWVKTALRLPPELHLELQDAALRNGHSMNAEIIARMKAATISCQLEKIAQEIAEIKSLDKQILSQVSNP